MSLDTILEKSVIKAVSDGFSSIQLAGGLSVQMRLVNACVLELTLIRAEKYPSLLEWHTVCKYFPWRLTSKPSQSGNTLTAWFPIHPKYISSLQDPLPLDYTNDRV